MPDPNGQDERNAIVGSGGQKKDSMTPLPQVVVEAQPPGGPAASDPIIDAEAKGESRD